MDEIVSLERLKRKNGSRTESIGAVKFPNGFLLMMAMSKEKKTVRVVANVSSKTHERVERLQGV